MRGFLKLAIAFAMAMAAIAQSKTLNIAGNRMEIQVERLSGEKWMPVDPALVFERGDRVRFRFRTNFDGYLYVTNISTSGDYSLLFPRSDTGEQNRIHAGTDYLLPATQTRFRIAGPAGHEILYFIVSPVEWRTADGGAHSGYIPLPAPPGDVAAVREPPNMTPRCDDTVFRARGDCVDPTAGARQTNALPPNLAGIPARKQDLMFLREENKSVIASPRPLQGPVVYEFLLAHK